MSDASTFQLRPAVSEGTERLEGQDAHRSTFAAAQALADTIRTTLGPKSRDKMLITADGKVVVTNDGASILDRLAIDHPAAELVIRIAEIQADETGDGTTTAVIFTGELLGNADALTARGIHPTTLTRGYHMAGNRALERLHEVAISVDQRDSNRLQEVARTAITGKWDDPDAAYLADLAVQAVQNVERDGEVERRKITRHAVAGTGPRQSEVIDGLVIDMDSSSTSVVSPEETFPRRIENATIALIDAQLTIETATGLGTVSFDGPEQHEAVLKYEDRIYETYVETIADTGADVVFCQKQIDEPVRYLLAREGILAVERTRKDELLKLGRATGATHVASVNHLTDADTGYAGLVERRTVGGQELAVVTDCRDPEQVSILLRGGTAHVNDEMKRILDDCLDALALVVETREVVPGGGATEFALAEDLREFAQGVDGREQLAIEAFADALEAIPRTLAENAGMDPIDSLVALRNRRAEGERTPGLDIHRGDVRDVTAEGVLEPLATKRRAITTAQESATILIRIDDVIAAAPDTHAEAEAEEHEHDPGVIQTSSEGYPWAIGHPMGGHGHGH